MNSSASLPPAPASLVNLHPTDSCGAGLVASILDSPSRRILDLALTSLANVEHRGAVGADGLTGDGAGVSTSIPQKLLQRWLTELDIEPPGTRVGIGVLFLPSQPEARRSALRLAQQHITSLGLAVVGVREVPVDFEQLGQQAAAQCPAIVQLFITSLDEDEDAFERQLFLARRSIELSARDGGNPPPYVVSMSCRTLVYKAMVMSSRLANFYPDLQDPDYACQVCLYHQRYSTNTAPQWELCQPFRMLAHNGEINTIRGNRNWMTARESTWYHPHWPHEHRRLIRRLFSFNDSDSASLDNALEFLTLSGRSLTHAASMLIPPAWESDPRMGREIKAFYEFHDCFCEPWDGPAAVVFHDGKLAAAAVDRNGLRPARFQLIEDDILIVGSEVGAARVSPAEIRHSGRLGPGQMIAVDLRNRQLLLDEQIKGRLAKAQPYAQWLSEHRIRVQEAEFPAQEQVPEEEPTRRRQIAAGMTRETLEVVLLQMAANGVEPTFSMGVDTPLAVLSRQPRPLSDYFQQQFAQVTNPPIDPIRERLGMSLGAELGPERNLLEATPQHCRVVNLQEPVLLPGQLHALTPRLPFAWETLDCSWPRSEGPAGLEPALRRLAQQAQLAVDNHCAVLILSDRAVSADRVAIPMLLALGAVHRALIKSGQRMMASLIAETSTVTDPHQLALLFGYGATAVDPYLAYDSIALLHAAGQLEGSLTENFQRFRKALNKGVLKVMSKMGISVLNSYQGAQIFEAIGLGQEVLDTCFTHSHAHLKGIGFLELGADAIERHQAGFASPVEDLRLPDLGILKPKRTGEHHAITGRVTKPLHQFVETNEPKSYETYRQELHTDQALTIRDLLDIRLAEAPLSLDQVESAESIRRRFTTAAMSLGAISPEAHEAIAVAMNRIGGKSNSGEGGEDPERARPRPDGTSANSRIKQVASGRFGVSAAYLVNADEIEIKMAQGAKPGEGGQLPGFKVNDLIARLRNTEPGVTLISPPPHHDIYSIEDIAQLIHDLKMVNPTARVSVKLVAKTGVGGIAVGVAKAGADTILISGHSGGTGASPLTSIKHAGLPWELGLAETHQSLVAAGLRDRVILRADGGLRTGRDVIFAALLGAEEFNFGTMALIALGCVYVKKCHLNNCPVGIATQDPKFRARFKGKPENLVNYLNAVADEVRQDLARLGVASLDELMGQTEKLQPVAQLTERAAMLDVSPLLHQPLSGPGIERTWSQKEAAPPPLRESFDDGLVEQLQSPSRIAAFQSTLPVANTDRNIGTRLSGWCVARQQQGFAVPEIDLELHGSAGQSLGAFLAAPVRLKLVGEANDYVGKGMSGGEIRLLPDPSSPLDHRTSVIAGNAVLYGATGGQLWASGRVAERFCVRNSGANAVVEGCGDHGCEYMTRGRAVVLGPIGNNFGAGMTGGCAFIWDPERLAPALCNFQTIRTQAPIESELKALRGWIETHEQKTGSPLAARLLSSWSIVAGQFVKIVPREVSITPAHQGQESTRKPTSTPSTVRSN